MLPRNRLRPKYLERIFYFPDQLHDIPFLPQILPPEDIDEVKLLEGELDQSAVIYSNVPQD